MKIQTNLFILWTSSFISYSLLTSHCPSQISNITQQKNPSRSQFPRSGQTRCGAS